jgi:SAM-dependent methyltransferase
MARLAIIPIVLMSLVLCACSGGGGPGRVKAADPDLVERIVREHNARVDGIDTLWARVSVRVRGLDAQGDRFEEQGEGHLQIVPPSNASLTVGKLGETYFAYGANAERYWMFDLSDSDRRAALVGDLSRVTRAKARALGLSVHPSDLVGAVGLDRVGLDEIRDARIEDGMLVLATPARWGASEWWFSTAPVELRRVVSFDDADRELARTELSRYKDLLETNRLPTGVEVPGQVEITTPGDEDGYVRIELSEPTRKPIRDVVYDFDRLMRAYRVSEVFDLDADPETSP